MTATDKSELPRNPWLSLLWQIPLVLLALVSAVFVAKGLRELPGIQAFLAVYPGHSALPASAPVGFPAWLAWQHALNSFFVLFILRSGWTIRRAARPRVFWTRNNDGLLRTAVPPIRITLPAWFHLVVDTAWVVNGVAFFVLLFATGQWMRVVPLGWDVIPNAVSTGIQYASLDWPLADGWVNYNALQLLSYFVTIFVAAPLALATGIRLAPGLAVRLRGLDRVFPLRVARSIHVAVMVYFVAFVIAHVTLVFATGALRNLNHVYAVRDDGGWAGFWVFAASVAVTAVVWAAARPAVLESLASLGGEVKKR